MTREVKVVTCCPENRFCPRDGKNHRKIPVYLFELNFLHRVLYTITELSYVLSFFIWVAEVPLKKFFTTCYSVFHRFCHVLSLLTFANLKLAFSLQKPCWNLEKQKLFKKIFISGGEKLFIKGTNLSNQLMMSCVWREFSSVRWKMMKEDSGVSSAQAWGCPHASPINIQGNSSV